MWKCHPFKDCGIKVEHLANAPRAPGGWFQKEVSLGRQSPFETTWSKINWFWKWNLGVCNRLANSSQKTTPQCWECVQRRLTSSCPCPEQPHGTSPWGSLVPKMLASSGQAVLVLCLVKLLTVLGGLYPKSEHHIQAWALLWAWKERHSSSRWVASSSGSRPVIPSKEKTQPGGCHQINKLSSFSSKITLLASSHPAGLYPVGFTPFLRAGVQATYIWFLTSLWWVFS